MPQIRIQPDYRGVSIVQMEPLLALGTTPITVDWANTRQELRLLRQCEGRDVTLVVKSLSLMERTATTLGLKYLLNSRMFNSGMESLAGKPSEWRGFTRRMGPGVSRGLLIRVAARGLRSGVDLPAARRVAVDGLFAQVSPVDADVLLILGNRGARV